LGDVFYPVDLHGANSELTDELVDLSRRYGILTPYTSFLAEEPTRLHAQAANVSRARRELNMLSDEVGGVLGVNQRAYKKMHQEADRGVVLNLKAGPEVVGEPRARSRAAVGPGSRFDAGASPPQNAAQATTNIAATPTLTPPAANAEPVATQNARGQVRVVETVRRVGQKTFFLKNGRWVDSSVTPEMEAKAITIEQFSDRYFELARSQTAELNQYLTFEEPVTVNLGGQVYKIERPDR
jgi:Ca-activated chloride channel family protein